MAYNPILLSEIQVKQPLNQELIQKVKDNFGYLHGLFWDTHGQIFNGSFEIDLDNDGVPDGWTRSLYTNGTGAYETASPAHGAKAYKFTHPGGTGNGGGYLESDYVSYNSIFSEKNCLGVIMWSTNAAMKNQVVLRWFDANEAPLGDSIILDSTNNPSTPTLFLMQFPTGISSNARFFKVRLVGGESSVNQNGTTYFDGVCLNPVEFHTASGSTNEFDMPDQLLSSEYWVDAGSSVLSITGNWCPILQTFPLQISFSAEIRCYIGDGTASQRFRIGSGYSNEVSTSSTSYISNTFALQIPAGTINPALPSTIYQQLKSHADIVVGRKQSGAASISW